MKIPIQPFDDRLRERIRHAIIDAFEYQYLLDKTDYDPDTCGTAADQVIAVLASEILGIKVTLAPQVVIGTATLVLDVTKAPS